MGGGRKVQKEEKIISQTRYYNSKNIILSNVGVEDVIPLKNNIKIKIFFTLKAKSTSRGIL